MAMVIKQYVWSISLRRASIPSIPPIPCSVPTCPCPHCPVLPTLSKYLLCLTFRLQTTSQQKPSFIPNTSHTLPAPSLATTGCQHSAAHRAIEVALNWHLICRQVITEYPVAVVTMMTVCNEDNDGIWCEERREGGDIKHSGEDSGYLHPPCSGQPQPAYQHWPHPGHPHQ